jgi:hypothetical protein
MNGWTAGVNPTASSPKIPLTAENTDIGYPLIAVPRALLKTPPAAVNT